MRARVEYPHHHSWSFTNCEDSFMRLTSAKSINFFTQNRQKWTCCDHESISAKASVSESRSGYTGIVPWTFSKNEGRRGATDEITLLTADDRCFKVGGTQGPETIVSTPAFGTLHNKDQMIF